jgi:hypothetical protein
MKVGGGGDNVDNHNVNDDPDCIVHDDGRGGGLGNSSMWMVICDGGSAFNTETDRVVA